MRDSIKPPAFALRAAKGAAKLSANIRVIMILFVIYVRLVLHIVKSISSSAAII